ncbi:hypothetical protein JRQ81_001778 [Phrynocephalus forsythii]|uniref:G-protein coupled receptors family 1 profile domain-containing protein n=1 Tax=Phrynocephalus forsythii TaxID=171643 RepID=A0A9Q1B867_9SAUR|nr:hypothetical protein JRQ81_001778 [Phrynocephalus forsythii]
MVTLEDQTFCWDIIDDSHVKEFEVAQWIKITLAVIYILIFVAGLLGNSVTIHTTKVLQKKGYLQKEVSDHMVSLACSDILVILLGMPVEFFSMIWSPFSTPRGDLACKLYCFLFEACSYATVLHVATLSFERWTVFQSSIFTAFIVYIVVLVSVAFMCHNMRKALTLHKQGTMAVRGETESQHRYLRKTENPEVRSSRKQTILFLGLIVATLAICWLPNQVRRIMAAAKPKQDWTVAYFRAYIVLLPIADIFFYLSSVVNPLLYNISSQQFRNVFLQVLRCHLTLEHVNKQRFLRANLNSANSSGRSRHPLIFKSSTRRSSTKRANKVFLSTFQSEIKPDCNLQKLSLESVELKVKTMPLETNTELSSSNQNGLCEHEL